MGNDAAVPRLNSRRAMARPAGSRGLRLLLFLGTRPEAVKLAPVIVAARAAGDVTVRLVSSGQHPQTMLEVLGHFGIELDRDCGLYHEGQTLAEIISAALAGFTQEIAAWGPDVVVVQGDTTSALAGALAALCVGIPVAHVEAGLRSHDLRVPFPEEANRRLIDTFADFLFAPTPGAAENLAAESVGGTVFVTGNTVVDAMPPSSPGPDSRWASHPLFRHMIEPNGFRGRVVVTAHRRESWGTDMDAIANGLARAARRLPEILFLLPLHPNPLVRQSFDGQLPGNVLVDDPLPYPAFIELLRNSDLVVTDSGGVVEEATCLGKQVIVVRRRTERPEAVKAGVATVVGIRSEIIESAIVGSLATSRRIRPPPSPVFGDGRAGERIVHWLRWRFGLADSRPNPFGP